MMTADVAAKYKTFDDMCLKDDLLRGIYAYGFEQPSVVQQVGIMPIISGKDVICQAQSGTGKTGTFSIATLQSIDIGKREVQTLIVSPTRELADQTFRVLSAIGDFLGVNAALCIGGARGIHEDRASIESGAQVVAGTPGRVFDLLNRGVLRPDHIRLLIIDEADEMLSLGFKDQIRDIVQILNSDVQVALVSATMPVEVLEIANAITRNPVRILIPIEEVALSGIRQHFIQVGTEDQKLDTLMDLYAHLDITKAIVFCNTKRKAMHITDVLTRNDFSVSTIHSDMDQAERKAVLGRFRNGDTRVLVATDLLARGIDVQQVSIVINYDLPGNRENYIHRIGRCGRFGRKGLAVNLVLNDDAPRIRELERFYSVEISELPETVSV